jgi:hypothetical protein
MHKSLRDYYEDNCKDDKELDGGFFLVKKDYKCGKCKMKDEERGKKEKAK